METKSLDFLQSIISRLAGNSFQMKTWNVALATAAIGFVTAKDSRPNMAVLAVIPSLAFWGLDAYYLALEKLFRARYELASEQIEPSFNLSPGTVDARKWFTATVRPAVLGLHLPMVVVILLVTVTGLRQATSKPVRPEITTGSAPCSPHPLEREPNSPP